MAIGRLFRGLAENLDQTRKEKIADMGGLEDRMSGPSIPGSFTFPGGFNFLGGGFPNISGFPNRGGFGAFMTGDLPGPVLGPDDFGSYQIPTSDPTYSSGFDYARSIAGGIPMSQVIAPGVSYSPEQPMGYTQEQLNTPVGTTPVEPPQKLPGPGEEGYGQGIGGVRIFDEIFDRKRRPLRDLPIPLSSLPRFDQAEMAENIAKTMRESGMDFTNLFGMPSVKPPSLEPEEPYRLRPPLTPELTPIPLRPTEELIAEGFIPPQEPITNVNVDLPNRFDLPEFGLNRKFNFTPPERIPPQEPISIGGIENISGPTPDIRDLILPPIASIENIAQDKRMANIPTSTPPIMPPMDAPVSLPDMLGIPTQTPPIMPPMDVPPMDIPPADFPPIVELPPIKGIGRPNQNRFSIQQLPRGLF